MWAQRGMFRYARLDGGPIEMVKGILSGWEYMFDPVNAYACCTAYDDDRLIELAKQAHVNWVWVTWSVGFSLESEAIQRKLAKRFLDRCHENGLKVTSYHSIANIFRKDFMEKHPEAESWLQRDKNGKIVPYTAVGNVEEAPRCLACLTSPEWRAYVNEHVGSAVDAGVDAVYFDNAYDGCYCQRCNERFRRYTQERLGKACDIPNNIEWLAHDKQGSTPLAMVWYDFQLAEIVDIYAEIKEFALGKNKDVLFYTNAHSCIPVDEIGDLILSEDCYQPYYDEKKGLTTNLAVLKYLYADGGPDKPYRNALHLLPWSLGFHPVEDYSTKIVHDTIYKLSIGEAASQGGNFYLSPEGVFLTKLLGGDAEILRIWGEIGKYNKFLEENCRYYHKTYQEAKIGIVSAGIVRKIERTLTNHDLLDMLATENLLFELVPIEYLNGQEAVAKYDLVILPGIENLSDEQVKLLASFCGNGGKLLGIAPVATHDENYDPRPEPAMTEILNGGDNAFFAEPIDKLLADESLKAKLVETIKTLAGRPLIEVGVTGPVVGNLMSTTDRKTRVLHLVNYSREKIAGLRVRMNGVAAEEEQVRVLSPDDVKTQISDFRRDAAGVEFTLGELYIYSLVVIESGQG